MEYFAKPACAIFHFPYGEKMRVWFPLFSFCFQVFTLIFVVEMFCKLVALGPVTYLQSKWNIFDGIIVIASVSIYFSDSGNGVNIFRSLRLVRTQAILKSVTKDSIQMFRPFHCHVSLSKWMSKNSRKWTHFSDIQSVALSVLAESFHLNGCSFSVWWTGGDLIMMSFAEKHCGGSLSSCCSPLLS